MATASERGGRARRITSTASRSGTFAPALDADPYTVAAGRFGEEETRFEAAQRASL
jgi:hypothetical protein